MGFHLALYFILLPLFLFLFLLCPILQAAEFQEPACGQEVCGNITISSPFVIHSSCYTISWFRVTCKTTPDGEKPFINVNSIDLEVLDSTSADAILISNPVAYINCDHTSEASVSVNLSCTPFFFSSESNNFGSVGCGNLATILSNEADSLGGCVQPRCDNGASESGCFTEMTANLTSYTVSMTAMYPDSNRCASAFIYGRDFFRSVYPLPTGINIETTHAPAVLNWNSTYCGDAGTVMVNHPIIYFNCRKNHHNGMSLNLIGTCFYYSDSDNIFWSSGCDGNCGNYENCRMLCLNTPSNYCSSESCPPHYEYDSCSTSIGTLFLILATWSNVEKITLFTSKEMENATDHYNENRILGQGGQGTVYKGMLIDGSIKFDEKKVEQFINEVIILSQINHRNVVKLLGCCLEAEVPLLVFEFIPNGTLYDLIHNQNEGLPLTWEMRLRIAIEIANALFYLHSAASAPIYHRDIKSSNILLDEKYRAKVSDFGTSRSVALEQTHLTTRVQGTFGYMDPEYFRSSQFTEKSDVYSFGVVLTELLTGQKPIPPTMKQVAMELELIKASGGNVIEDRGDEEYEIDDMIHSWETNPSVTFPLNSSF
ncbi:hypothetical protein E1A91_D09G020800v1 [Gossypium mustelinum]|uniref:Protein kinase domain-containing protein n=1 Tax=Gossypium mustelinum TaxID=34275 RepID=A0A5D2TFQ8_GOSMU|nr:hypothetical protein E1A91_D09G020800v1 [Gossypium mustelinum]